MKCHDKLNAYAMTFEGTTKYELQDLADEIKEEVRKIELLVSDLWAAINCDLCPMYGEDCWVRVGADLDPCRMMKRISALGIEV